MDNFKLPITFLDECYEIPENTKIDLELTDNSPIYTQMFKSSSPLSLLIIPQWTSYYTDNKIFLKDTQKIILSNLPQIQSTCHDKIFEEWKEIELATNDRDAFHAKYQFVEWEQLYFMNNNSLFLQILAITNLASPFMTLILPILMCIIPFFIIKLKGAEIDFTTYFTLLKKIFSQHAIGRFFSQESKNPQEIFAAYASIIFFGFQVYSNIRTCTCFYKNINTIQSKLFILKKHLSASIQYMQSFSSNSSKLTTYQLFNNSLSNHIKILNNYYNKIKNITSPVFELSNYSTIGSLMKSFYQIYYCDSLKKSLAFSIGFTSYLYNINSIKQLIFTKQINKCKWSNKKSIFYNQYFPITDQKPISNHYKSSSNIIITGPNAAGKTTYLKASLFNVIISQQIGYGFFSSAFFKPFRFIHSYINIPDTSERDSLFQAEARRCKNIIDKIIDKKNTHFCIFDELYSGTNPDEAIASGQAFLEYLNSYKNVTFIITTHYTQMCKNITNSIKNKSMDIKIENDKYLYTYKLVNGISEIKGGIKVFKEMNYPQSIINKTQYILLKNSSDSSSLNPSDGRDILNV